MSSLPATSQNLSKQLAPLQRRRTSSVLQTTARTTHQARSRQPNLQQAPEGPRRRLFATPSQQRPAKEAQVRAKQNKVPLRGRPQNSNLSQQKVLETSNKMRNRSLKKHRARQQLPRVRRRVNKHWHQATITQPPRPGTSQGHLSSYPSCTPKTNLSARPRLTWSFHPI